MMKKRQGTKRLKGTVLYTVVSVLMVLIVFLMGTLALAATASNRAYSNYQKEQTQITGRTILDAVVKAINEDTSTSGIKKHISDLSTVGNSTAITVNLEGVNYTVTATKVETRQVFDEANQEWKNGSVYELTTRVVKTMADTEYSVRIMDMDAGGGGGGGGGGAFVSLGGVDGGKIGTAGLTTGGTEINIGGDPNASFSFDNTAKQQVPLYVNGNLEMKSQVTAYYNKVAKNQYFAVTGNLTLSNNFILDFSSELNPTSWDKDTAVDYASIPCVYAGKTLSLGASDLEFGSTNVPVNIYAGNLADYTGKKTIHGNMYLFDETATSTFGGNDNSFLYRWVHKTVTGKDGSSGTEVFGSLYCAGNLVLNATDNNEIGGDVRVAKDLTIAAPVGNKTYKVVGDVVCGGTLTLNDNLSCKNVYADTIVVPQYKTLTCTNLKANTIIGGGTINASASAEYSSIGDPITSRLTWYTGYTELGTGVDNPWGPWYVEYSVTENVREVKADGSFEDKPAKVITDRKETWVDSDYDQARAQIPVEYTANTTDATAIVEDFGAPLGVVINAPSNVITAVRDVKTMYGTDIYPQDYTKTEIDANIIEAPQQSNYTTYPSSLAEINNSITIMDAMGNLTIPIYSSMDDVWDVGGTNATKITTSCVLNGSFSESHGNKNIYIKPSGSVVIILDNFSLADGSSIVIDDNHGDVFFFVKSSAPGSYSVSISGGSIITTDYIELFKNAAPTDDELRTTNYKEVLTTMQVPLTISQKQSAGSKYFPNVYMYSEPGGSVYVGNNAFLTMNVRAQYMSFKQATSSKLGKAVNYLEVQDTGATLTTNYTTNDYVGVIGQLICDKIEVANNWGMLYVTQGSIAPPCTCGCPTCVGTPGCTCCSGGTPCCATCTCAGSGSHPSVPDHFTTTYYSYY